MTETDDSLPRGRIHQLVGPLERFLHVVKGPNLHGFDRRMHRSKRGHETGGLGGLPASALPAQWGLEFVLETCGKQTT